jgi:hypothetical protein
MFRVSTVLNVMTVFLAGTQFWDFVTGKLRKDLQYQADEQFLMHEGAVIALAFSRDSELLVSGSQDGKVKVGTPLPWFCSCSV